MGSVELRIINQGKKKKPKKKAKAGGKKMATKTATKKKAPAKGGEGKKGGKRRRKPATPAKRSRRRGRRRNPGIDWTGSAAALAGGAVGYIVGQPAAHLPSKFVDNKHVKRLLAAGASLVVPGGIGLAAQGWLPNFGKGMIGAAGAQIAANGLAMVAQTGDAPGLLAKAGFAQLGAPDDVFMRDGSLFRVTDGGEQRLMPMLGQPEQIALETDNGQVPALLLGSFENDNGAQQVVQTPDGQLLLISGEIVREDPTIGDVVREDPTIGDEDDALGVGGGGDSDDALGGDDDDEGL